MYIIFDFDGTLADTFALGSQLINEYADQLGYKQIDFAANKDKSARELIKMSGVRFWQIPGLMYVNKSVKPYFCKKMLMVCAELVVIIPN